MVCKEHIVLNFWQTVYPEYVNNEYISGDGRLQILYKLKKVANSSNNLIPVNNTTSCINDIHIIGGIWNLCEQCVILSMQFIYLYNVKVHFCPKQQKEIKRATNSFFLEKPCWGVGSHQQDEYVKKMGTLVLSFCGTADCVIQNGVLNLHTL